MSCYSNIIITFKRKIDQADNQMNDIYFIFNIILKTHKQMYNWVYFLKKKEKQNPLDFLIS